MVYLSGMAAAVLAWPPDVRRVELLLMAADQVLPHGRRCRTELDPDQVLALVEAYQSLAQERAGAGPVATSEEG